MQRKPRGKILVITAILLPAIMGFMALSVDLAVIATSQAQLQTVSDAASLAAASQLANENRVRGNDPNQNPNARTSSSNQGTSSSNTDVRTAIAVGRSVALANRVLNSEPVLYDNPDNTAEGDIVVGYVDPKTRLWVSPPLANSNLMNAVLVNASRSPTHGGPVPGFFSRVWAYTGTGVATQSIASAQNYPILGVKNVNNARPHVLPITLDHSTYDAMMEKTTTDEYTYDPASQKVVASSDNVYESKLFPVSTGNPGNWGTINIGVDSNSTQTQVDQILNGLTPAQVNYYGGALQLMLQGTGEPPSITFSGNPGLSAGLQNALTQIIGRPSILPIYDLVNDRGGANAEYRVIALQAVRVMAVDFQGASKYVIVQPCLIREATIIANTDTTTWPTGWGWQSGGVVKLHLAK